MNKNVLILSSSPRRGGNSDRLCDPFLQGCKDAGHTVEKIFLKDKHINYCTGCGICSMYGKPCPQKDDAAEVLEKMIAADVMVMATPVYFYTTSAQMKTLIDRCCARYTEITNKNFYFIVTAAEPSIPAMERTIDGFRGFLDCLEGAREKGIIYGTGVWKVGEIEGKPVLKEAYPTDYHSVVEQDKKEINTTHRPALKNDVQDFDKYDIIFIGSPNWWSTIAPPVATFLERHDFSGKTIVPFMTHGGGRFGHSISDMKKLCPDASSSEGLAIRDSYVNDNRQDVVKWLQTLKLLN